VPGSGLVMRWDWCSPRAFGREPGTEWTAEASSARARLIPDGPFRASLRSSPAWAGSTARFSAIADIFVCTNALVQSYAATDVPGHLATVAIIACSLSGAFFFHPYLGQQTNLNADRNRSLVRPRPEPRLALEAG
jgi:hypothetical protein